jgi:formylglycine-generating enzyme required for sulfatase activity
MNLTNQYIANPKSRDIYTKSLASYKSIRTTNTRLRLSNDRQILNLKEKKGIFRIGNTQFKMIYCPRGEIFEKARDENYNEYKKIVTIEKPFLLGETEVTQELFETVMGYNPSEFQGKGYPNSKQRPVEKVTWYEAVMFCNRLSQKLGKRPYYNISNVYFYESGETVRLENIASADVTTNPQANGFRLPLEKEWEYAAKAGTDNKWAGTNNKNQVKEVAWLKDNSEKQTHPVKCKRPNEWGFYDMSGNVSEWCYDLYNSTSIDRIHRGGSWLYDASNLRSDSRSLYSPLTSNGGVGFRVASSLGN